MDKKINEKGFTLLELLVSLAIVGLVLLAFFRVIDSTQRINTKNDADIKALNILQSEIENLRNQIKQSPDENGERVLVVTDEKANGKEEDIEIKFGESLDTVNVRKYLKRGKDLKPEYEINNLEINRKIIKGNDKSKNSIFNDYQYTINISAVLIDDYFSKKQTEINDVIILSSGMKEEGSINPEPEIPPLNKETTYSIKIKTNEITNEGWLFSNKGEQIRLAKDESVISDNHFSFQHNGETIRFNLSKDRLKLIYQKKEPKLQLKISRNSADNDDFNYTEEYKSYFDFGDTGYKKVSIYIEHTGVKLKDVKVNNKTIGDVDKNIEIQVEGEDDIVEIEFNGAERINSGNQIENLPSQIRSELFIKFSK